MLPKKMLDEIVDKVKTQYPFIAAYNIMHTQINYVYVIKYRKERICHLRYSCDPEHAIFINAHFQKSYYSKNSVQFSLHSENCFDDAANLIISLIQFHEKEGICRTTG